jgi:hypothetical protein
VNPRTQAAYAAAGDSLKQVLTLSTALLGFEITFAKDLLWGVSLWMAYTIWISLLVSIVSGVAGLLALTGRLGRAKRSPVWRDTYLPSIRLTGAFCVLGFLTGVGFIVAAGIQGLHRSGDKPADSTIKYPFYWAPYLAAPAPAPPSTVKIELPSCTSNPCCGTRPTPAEHHVKRSKRVLRCSGGQN